MGMQEMTIVFIGVLGGFLSGMLGIGGAIVIIPALVLFLGFSQQLAQGTTLLMLALPVAALAAFQYYRAGNADLKTAMILALSFFISGYLGAKVAMFLPQDVLKKIFAFLLIFIAIKILFFGNSPR